MGADQGLGDYLVACSKAQDPHYDTEPKHKAQVSRKMGLQEAMIAELRQEKEVLLAKIAELQAENERLRAEKESALPHDQELTHQSAGRTCVTPKKMHIIAQLVSSARMKLKQVPYEAQSARSATTRSTRAVFCPRRPGAAPMLRACLGKAPASRLDM